MDYERIVQNFAERVGHHRMTFIDHSTFTQRASNKRLVHLVKIYETPWEYSNESYNIMKRTEFFQVYADGIELDYVFKRVAEMRLHRDHQVFTGMHLIEFKSWENIKRNGAN